LSYCAEETGVIRDVHAGTGPHGVMSSEHQHLFVTRKGQASNGPKAGRPTSQNRVGQPDANLVGRAHCVGNAPISAWDSALAVRPVSARHHGAYR
jgi:hypothetical protein